jgi:DNA (cytosine-5)-methyltransferase 1
MARAITGVEFEADIAAGFKLNHKAEGSQVCSGNINDLARTAFSALTGSAKYAGATGGKSAGESDARGRPVPLPPKGAADIIMGGPPCQGFSSMNRFGSGDSR